MGLMNELQSLKGQLEYHMRCGAIISKAHEKWRNTHENAAEAEGGQGQV
jgi:hypothetical protein